MLLMAYVVHAFASVHCCLLVTCCERADLLVLICDFLNCVYVTFPCGILGQVLYLFVSNPDLCRLSYFHSRSSGRNEQRFLFECNTCRDK